MRSAVDVLFARQVGLATIAQLLGAGVTREQVRSRLARGPWRLVLPGVVVEDARPMDQMRRLVAGQLLGGEGAMIAAASAATWHGVRSASAGGHVRVDVPHLRHPRSHGFVVVRRTRRPDPYPIRAQGLWVASPARAVADAAREAGGERARAIVLEAVQRRIAEVGELRHHLEAGPRPGSRALRAALADAERGAWSVPEADLAALVRGSQLPPMWSNPRLTTTEGVPLPVPDGWFDDVGLAVQVQSKRYHAGELDWEATVSADGVFAEHGVPVVALTPRQIATDPAALLARIGRAHEQARRRPRPDVRAAPRSGVP